MFSKILEDNKRAYNGMAFATSSHLHAEKRATEEAMAVLRDWFSGIQSREDVEDALKCLVILYGDNVKMAARFFWKALRCDEWEEREVYATEAMQRIERYFSRNEGLCQTITGWEHIHTGNRFA